MNNPCKIPPQKETNIRDRPAPNAESPSMRRIANSLLSLTRCCVCMAFALSGVTPALAADAPVLVADADNPPVQAAAENPATLGDNRAATLGDVKTNRQELHAAIDANRRELRAAIDANRQELRAAIDRLSDKVSTNFLWTLGLIVALLGLPQLPGWITGIKRAVLRHTETTSTSATAS